MKDPIIDEVRAVRDQIAREHNYDVHSIFRMLRQAQAKGGHYVSFPPKLIPQTNEDTRKGRSKGRRTRVRKPAV
jgi:hypothetical protein